ncbi:helix-turn-helix domain-containing protein [Chryseobacterium sp. SIMBA_038]|uniref:helix-turn-helix domain-containing protein n=1 Tax=Chryseobacterium sp. SIMBA_038 TaxID=3085780 RepID=UPI0039793D6D
MDRKTQKINPPNYKKIYADILAKKFPHKVKDCTSILLKEELSFLDIIKLNQRIFGYNEISSINQRLRSYDNQTIIEILNYQKTHKLNNSQLSLHFKLSRNTIAKWKMHFAV